MRRDDICLYLGPADRVQLQALLTDRNTPRKVVWRAEIVLATADGCGTNEIMRRTETSKPTVWRWQARYLAEGVAGLRRDKTRPSRVPPLPRETRLKVITKTVQETPPNATHWSRALMVRRSGFRRRAWDASGRRPFSSHTLRAGSRGVDDLEAAI
jgi:transposase